MESKLFEIRDKGTCVPALAVRVSGEDGPIMRRAGFGNPMVLLTMLAHPMTQWDPYAWPNGRTMRTVHLFIEEHWNGLVSDQVIDVRVLLGEATEPAEAECV